MAADRVYFFPFTADGYAVWVESRNSFELGDLVQSWDQNFK